MSAKPVNPESSETQKSSTSTGARPTRAAGSFYGRRKAKMLKPAQAQLMETLFPDLRLDISKPVSGHPGTLFGFTPRTIHLEIGFGAGEHLIHHAKSKPETGFIGCEPFINGMAKAVSTIAEDKINNIRLYDEDAVRLLDWLPDNSLDGIDLFYPDPWPKKRHWKRRFINHENLIRFHRVLKPDGIFRFASDIDHYVNWTLFHVSTHNSSNFKWLVETATDWNEPFENWLSTRYEQKAKREGRKPAYLVFQKN